MISLTIQSLKSAVSGELEIVNDIRGIDNTYNNGLQFINWLFSHLPTRKAQSTVFWALIWASIQSFPLSSLVILTHEG